MGPLEIGHIGAGFNRNSKERLALTETLRRKESKDSEGRTEEGLMPIS